MRIIRRTARKKAVEAIQRLEATALVSEGEELIKLVKEVEALSLNINKILLQKIFC